MYKVIILLFGILVFIAGCGGSDSKGVISDTKVEIKKVLEGVFFDSIVVGAKYKTPTMSGVTDSRGIFKFKEGEEVEFFINNISLGKAKPQVTPANLSNKLDAKSIVTPFILAKNNSQKAVKIAQLLISLDRDSNPDNGIDIDISNLKVDINKSLNIDTLDLNKSVKSLVSKNKVQKHLESFGVNILNSSDINQTKETLDINISNSDENKSNKDKNQDRDKYKNEINTTNQNDTTEDIKESINSSDESNDSGIENNRSFKDELNSTKKIDNNIKNDDTNISNNEDSVSDLNMTTNKNSEDNISESIDTTLDENSSSEQNSTNQNSNLALKIPKNYNQRVLNSSKEEVTGNLDGYTITIYTNSQPVINEQAPHKGLVVKFNGKQSETLSISNSYIGKTIIVVLTDNSNNIIALSNEIKVEDIPVIVVNLK